MKVLFQYIVAVSVMLTTGVADAKTVQDHTRNQAMSLTKVYTFS